MVLLFDPVRLVGYRPAAGRFPAALSANRVKNTFTRGANYYIQRRIGCKFRPAAGMTGRPQGLPGIIL